MNFSKNPVRNSICTALHLRGRKFYIPYGAPIPPRPTSLQDFLTGKCCIYLMVMPEIGRESCEQVWEGFMLREIIENHKIILPRIWNEYTKNNLPYDVFELLDKFTRMDNPVKMAAYATRKLAHIKRY